MNDKTVVDLAAKMLGPSTFLAGLAAVLLRGTPPVGNAAMLTQSEQMVRDAYLSLAAFGLICTLGAAALAFLIILIANAEGTDSGYMYTNSLLFVAVLDLVGLLLLCSATILFIFVQTTTAGIVLIVATTCLFVGIGYGAFDGYNRATNGRGCCSRKKSPPPGTIVAEIEEKERRRARLESDDASMEKVDM